MALDKSEWCGACDDDASGSPKGTHFRPRPVVIMIQIINRKDEEASKKMRKLFARFQREKQLY